MRAPWQKRPWYRRIGWWDLLVGVALIALGAASLMNPDLAVEGLAYAYGIAGVIVGVADILRYIRVERFTGFGPLLSLISGVLSVMAGVVILVNPGVGIAVFSLLFSVWFIAHCISRLAGRPVPGAFGGGERYVLLRSRTQSHRLSRWGASGCNALQRRRGFGLPGRVVPYRFGSGKRCHGVFPPVRWHDTI